MERLGNAAVLENHSPGTAAKLTNTNVLGY